MQADDNAPQFKKISAINLKQKRTISVWGSVAKGCSQSWLQSETSAAYQMITEDVFSSSTSYISRSLSVNFDAVSANNIFINKMSVTVR